MTTFKALRAAPRTSILLVIVASAVVFGCCDGVAVADEAPAGGLTLHTFAMAGSFSVGESPARCDEVPSTILKFCYGYQVTATNAGAAPAEGPIVLKEQLPPGFSVSSHRFLVEPAFHFEPAENEDSSLQQPGSDCEEQGEPVMVTCTFPGALAPDEALTLRLSVTVAEATPSGQPATTSVSGPGSPEASVSEPLEVGSTPLSFGPSSLVTYIAGANGAPDTQAGGHPYEFTTRLDLNNTVRVGAQGFLQLTSVHDVKDVVVDLPVGLLGDAQAAEKCTFAQLQTFAHCPPGAKVGQIKTQPEGTASAYTAIFNMVPSRGAAAEFGFVDGLGSPHAIYASLAPTPAGYVVRAINREVPQIGLTNVTATFFGDPALRDGSPSTPVPMFTNPSDCSSGPPAATVHLDSWQEPGAFASNATPQGEPEVGEPNWVSLAGDQWPVGGTVTPATTAAVTGCNLLHFNPSAFTVKPDTQTADSPTGLTFDLKIPQPETVGALATPPLRDASVTLPAGLTVDPSAGNGLQACSEAQIGWLGASGPHGEALPEVDGPHGKEPNRGLSNFTSAAPTCPDASNIGSVEVTSPLIESTLQGSVYLARQQENPFGSLLAGYIVIDDPVTGTIVKIPGELKADPVTGQITGVFDQNPQFPFSDLKLRFTGGERGDLRDPGSVRDIHDHIGFRTVVGPRIGPRRDPVGRLLDHERLCVGFCPGV